jgi:electron transfer flavoprotein alpha subunit
MADILVYSEQLSTAKELTYKAKEFAGALGLGASAAVLGPDASAKAPDLAAVGADKIYVSEDPALAELAIDVVADALAQIAKEADATYVLLGSTRLGKELAGRLAQKLDAGAATDVNAVEVADGVLVAAHYSFGGATVARETIDTPVKVLAVMPKTFEIDAPSAGAGEVVTPSLSLSPSPVKLVGRKEKEGESVNLEGAVNLVCIGRGFGTKEDIELANQLCAALNAELGCTKSLCDWEWLPEARLVGLSGAKTKPSLYVSVGISGQVQHTVGVGTSKIIACINKDEKALMFGASDYGIVGDLYEVLPVLTEKLKAL